MITETPELRGVRPGVVGEEEDASFGSRLVPTSHAASPAGSETRLDDWPHTKRVLPWMIAGFIAMLWLVPFNTISMKVSLPFELKLDRIVLPFIIVVWCLALAVGSRNATRLRLTPIHIAVGTFVAVAFVSVLVNLPWLNRGLLLNNSMKGLTLLISYATFFVIVASVVRPSEVPAFVKYTLVLAVICGLGAIWEYRFQYNPFYQVAHSILPKGLFTLPVPDPTAVDDMGRRMTLGPTEQPLELAAMLALALPIALSGLMHTPRRWGRMLYGVAACVLLAAGVATFRKSSLVTPAVIILALVALRPRQALRLSPLVPVIFVVVHLMAPGAIGSVIQQLDGSQLATASTTAHRAAAYEAIRPLVWARPAFGQGYGSYNANLIRIFDSQVLDTLIETGVVGLLAYLSVMLTVLGSAWSLFRERTNQWSGPALALGVAAISFFTSSFLFDAMGFPHVPYVFLTFAAFVAVLAAQRREGIAVDVSGAGQKPRA